MEAATCEVDGNLHDIIVAILLLSLLLLLLLLLERFM